MRDVVLYIAVSLDGYIADPNGGVSWLDSTEKEPNDEKMRHIADIFQSHGVECKIN